MRRRVTMQIDELRNGLTTLADEMEGFERDVSSLHRRERRRRVVVSSVAAALVVALGVSTVAVARRDNHGRIQVAAAGSKEVAPNLITRLDAVVVPVDPSVAALLDASPLVVHYAHVARLPNTFGGSAPVDTRAALCALTRADGYVVQVTTPGPAVGGELSALLAGHARAYALDFQGDLEVFFEVDASRSQIDSASNAVRTDGDVSHATFVSKEQAYAMFAKDFGDQPALVKSTKPSDLPESILITLRGDRSIDAVRQRYEHFAGVDTVLTNRSAGVLDPVSRSQREATTRGTSAKACPKA
jgi:hypothetical protein